MRTENEERYAAVYHNGAVLNHVRKNTSRKLISLFGSVVVNRLGYSQRKKDSQFPLDKELNLPDNQYSDGLRQRFVHEAIKSSFDESVKSIDRLTGGHVPKRQGVRLVHDISQDFEAFYAQKRFFEPEKDDIIILRQTKRQLERAKQRLMDVLHERRLRLSRKKTPIGSIDKGFHFLGINYLEPQPLDGTNVTQVSDDSAAHFAHCLIPMREREQFAWA